MHTNPNIAYILFLIGLYGIIFECLMPGMILPALIGIISLISSLLAFYDLSINYVGFCLLLLGIVFIICEFIVTSFGILGISGVVAFITGSILLLDVHSPGFEIAWSLIIGMTCFTMMFFLCVVRCALKISKRKIVSGKEALIGSKGFMINTTHAQVLGEIWQVNSAQALQKGQSVTVLSVDGIILNVALI